MIDSNLLIITKHCATICEGWSDSVIIDIVEECGSLKAFRDSVPVANLDEWKKDNKFLIEQATNKLESSILSLGIDYRNQKREKNREITDLMSLKDSYTTCLDGQEPDDVVKAMRVQHYLIAIHAHGIGQIVFDYINPFGLCLFREFVTNWVAGDKSRDLLLDKLKEKGNDGENHILESLLEIQEEQ